METLVQIGGEKKEALSNKNSIVGKLQRRFAEDWEATGGLSVPSKMPGFAYSTPAKACQTGAKLQEVVGSTCEKCYALKGNYTFPKIQERLYKRLYALNNPDWIPSMALLINTACEMVNEPFFRWHDSGDLQGVWHIENIVEVCKLTPTIQHWLPTREYKMVIDYLRKINQSDFPKNLTIRLSAHMIDGQPPGFGGVTTSTVSTTGKSITEESVFCDAYTRGGYCGSCRACWQPEIQDVTYPKH